MGFELLEVTGPGLAYIVLGGFVVIFSMVSLLVKERLYINEVVLGTGFGILMGPYCAGIFDPRSWGPHEHEITLEVMRIVLATGLFAIGVELPKAYLREHMKSLAIMVVPTMAFGWLIVAGVLKALIPGLNFVSCLAISACLTPTDPIISAAIVGGRYAIKHVPTNLRQILSAESAANDGLAYPFLTLALYLTIDRTSDYAIEHWFLVGWLYQVILGTIIGALIGLGFCRLMQFTHKKEYIDRESYVAQYLALTFLTIGICSTLGVDDLLGAFAAGSAISWDGHFNTQVEGEVFATVIDLVLNCGCFIYIGAWLPFNMYNTPELGVEPWKLVVLFLAILGLRRIPALLILYRAVPEIESWKEALFSGHFGPMGVGAMFVSTLAITKLPEPADPPQSQQDLLALTLRPIVSFVVLCSILIHGLSIPFFTLSRKVGSRTLSVRNTISNMPVPDWLSSTRRMNASETSEPGLGRVEAGLDGLDANVEGPHVYTSQPQSMPMSARTSEDGQPTNATVQPSSDKPNVILMNKDANEALPDGVQTPRTVHFPEESRIQSSEPPNMSDLRARLRTRLNTSRPGSSGGNRSGTATPISPMDSAFTE